MGTEFNYYVTLLDGSCSNPLLMNDYEHDPEGTDFLSDETIVEDDKICYFQLLTPSKNPNFDTDYLETEELAVDFVNAIDKLSQSIFRELISFSWTLTSDGFDYIPGGIGCCNKKYLYEKRELIAQKVKGLPEGARDMMNAIYSNPDKQKEVADNLANKKCVAGAQSHSGKITNNNRAYFKERISIPPFKLKDK